MWAQVENSKRRRNRSTLLSSQHLEGYKGMLELQDGTRKSWQASLTHTGLHTTHTKWLVHSWSTLGAKTSHGQHGHTRLTTARTWGKPPPSPLIVYSVAGHGAYIQMTFLSQDSRVEVPKSCQLGLPRLWSPITLWTDLWLRCGLKQSCSSCRKLFNNMSHVICRQINRVDSRLFLVGSQIGSLTPDLFFGHNLCFRCLNE